MAATAPEPAPSSRRLVTLGVLTGTALGDIYAGIHDKIKQLQFRAAQTALQELIVAIEKSN